MFVFAGWCSGQCYSGQFDAAATCCAHRPPARQVFIAGSDREQQDFSHFARPAPHCAAPADSIMPLPLPLLLPAGLRYQPEPAPEWPGEKPELASWNAARWLTGGCLRRIRRDFWEQNLNKDSSSHMRRHIHNGQLIILVNLCVRGPVVASSRAGAAMAAIAAIAAGANTTCYLMMARAPQQCGHRAQLTCKSLWRPMGGQCKQSARPQTQTVAVFAVRVSAHGALCKWAPAPTASMQMGARRRGGCAHSLRSIWRQQVKKFNLPLAVELTQSAPGRLRALPMGGELHLSCSIRAHKLTWPDSFAGSRAA